MKKNNHAPEKISTVSIWASYACAIHCMLMPFIGSLLPFIGLGFLNNEWVEIGFILFAISFGSISLINSYIKIHKKIKPLMIFFIGMFTLIGAQLFLEKNIVLEIPVAVLGALIIAIAHLINRRIAREYITCNSHIPS